MVVSDALMCCPEMWRRRYLIAFHDLSHSASSGLKGTSLKSFRTAVKSHVQSQVPVHFSTGPPVWITGVLDNRPWIKIHPRLQYFMLPECLDPQQTPPTCHSMFVSQMRTELSENIASIWKCGFLKLVEDNGDLAAEDCELSKAGDEVCLGFNPLATTRTRKHASLQERRGLSFDNSFMLVLHVDLPMCFML